MNRLPGPRTGVRWLYLLLAYICVALGVIGIVVPGLPTTPFLLLAAWAASRGSVRLHQWLLTHPHLGPPLCNWQEQGAIHPRAKRLAVLLLLLSWLVLVWKVDSWLLPALLGVFFLCMVVFLLTRPNPKQPPQGEESRHE